MVLIDAINDKLARLLPSFIGEQCSLVRIQEDTAVLHVPSSAWKTKISYNTPKILETLNHNLGDLGNSKVEKIKIKIVLASDTPSRLPKPVLSKQSSQMLRQLAKCISHTKLNTALVKLSQNSTNK